MIYILCPRCGKSWAVGPQLYEQFGILRCEPNGCGSLIDRRASRKDPRGAPGAPSANGLTAEDLKLLEALRVGWEARHA